MASQEQIAAAKQAWKDASKKWKESGEIASSLSQNVVGLSNIRNTHTPEAVAAWEQNKQDQLAMDAAYDHYCQIRGL